MKHRIVELFGNTIQGEGKWVGQPTIFVRYHGCTLNCRGFGMPRGTLSYEYDGIVKDLSKYDNNDLKKLPLVKTGCDSYPAIAPECLRFAKEYETPELLAEILKIIPESSKKSSYHICFTGGEPMIYQDIVADLIIELARKGIRNVTFETNGTVALKNENREKLETSGVAVTWSISPKTSISGNPKNRAFNKEAIGSYFLNHNDYYKYLKFVVETDEDIMEVKQWIEEYKAMGCNKDIEEIYLMPVGGTADQRQSLTAVDVANLCWKHGYRYSPREHITLFGNSWEK